MSKITFFCSLFKADDYIDSYVDSWKKVKNINLHNGLFINVKNSHKNSERVKNKILELKNVTNLKIIDIENDLGIYGCFNLAIQIAETELVCNINLDDKLHEDFITIALNEFEKDKELDMLCYAINVSKKANESWDDAKKNDLMFHKKKVFYEINENISKNVFGEFFENKKTYEEKIKIFKDKSINPDLKTKAQWVLHDGYLTILDLFTINGDIVDLDSYTAYCCMGPFPLWKKKLFEKFGGFNEKEFGVAADYELWLRYLKNGAKIKLINRVMGMYFGNPYSKGHREHDEDILKKITYMYHPMVKLIQENSPINFLIPYRNRKENLKYLIEKINTFYKNSKIFIVEQNDDDLFKKTLLINAGMKYITEKEHVNNIIISDLECHPLNSELYKNLDYTRPNHIFGIKDMGIIMGGVLTFNKTIIKKCNGYCNHFYGWGSEDIDIAYRLFFKNIIVNSDKIIYRGDESNDLKEIKNYSKDEKIYEENKTKSVRLNNNTLIQQIVNYNLIYYYENKNKFNLIKNKIYYEDVLFFEGDFNNSQLKKGKLYDILNGKKIYPSPGIIKSDNVIIYEGEFINGLPTGIGCGYNLWQTKNIDLDGIWINGYFLSKESQDLNKFNIINIDEEFEKYKKYVLSGMNELDLKYDLSKENNITFIKINTKNYLYDNILHTKVN